LPGKFNFAQNFNSLVVSHKNIQAITQITRDVMFSGLQADKAFEAFFKSNKSVAPSDIAFIVEQVYYLIRNWRLLIEIQSRGNLGEPSGIITLLAIGWIVEQKQLPDFIKIDRLRRRAISENFKSVNDNRAIMYSVPDWLDNIGHKELTDHWLSILQALNQEAALVIRANTIKCSRDKLLKELLALGLEIRKSNRATDALILKNKLNVFKLPQFKQGWFEMQDISSQLIGHFVNPQPGMRVIDACAGNGGKTLHLASLMQNKGRIIALDIFPTKLETLKCRTKRAGVSIVETRAIDSTKVIKRLHNTADLVLLDVPCSGLGVLKRNPEIKWKLQPTDLDNLRKTQEDVLSRYSLMVKPGGKLVYSTCSILPSENTCQIQKFIDKNGDKFEFAEERFVSPTEGFDGFYMAAMIRK